MSEKQAGIELIAAERRRQIEKGQMAAAAACYALECVDPDVKIDLQSRIPPNWPWGDEWWKPSADPIRNLEKAGALIAAEIDRLLRAGKGRNS